MMLFGLLFTIAVVVGIVLLVGWAARGFRNGVGGGWNPSPSQTPREVLQARYARGEITRDQYRQVLDDLRWGGCLTADPACKVYTVSSNLLHLSFTAWG